MSGRTVRRGRGARRLLIDLTPVRRSRDLRCLVLGQLISVFGTQLTTVAVPYQVYQLTHSSLDVGLVSLAQLFPLIAGSLLGGSVVDAIDRHRDRSAYSGYLHTPDGSYTGLMTVDLFGVF